MAGGLFLILEMVRLQGALSWSAPTASTVSIPKWYDCKTGNGSPISRFVQVSIPKWYDCKREVCNHRYLCLQVSIPKWYDCKRAVGPVSIMDTEVSIPKWYDCKPGPRRLMLDCLNRFNSKMVRLQVHRAC